MVQYSRKRLKRLLKQLSSSLDELSACQAIDLEHGYELSTKKVRLPLAEIPFQLLLGKPPKVLQLAPEPRFDAAGRAWASGNQLLFDPEVFFDQIAGFVRLRPGDFVDLGSGDPEMTALLGLPPRIPADHLRIRHKGNSLMFKRLDAEAHTCLTPLLQEQHYGQISAWRRRHLQRLAEVLPGPITRLKKKPAQRLITEVAELLDREPLRPRDKEDRPGGLVELPIDVTPIIVGDLHGQIDNLLVILSQNGFLDGLISGQAALILLGDAVHPETDGHLDEMETSMVMMDLIFRLKLRFPERVFYLRGNHDAFSEEISKQGVPQGLLWRQHLHKARGPVYVEAMEHIYANLPYVASSRDFLACHAGAPTRKTSREDLVDIRRHAKLAHQLTHNRLHRPDRPAGYKKGDVRRFRECLHLDPTVPFIVGHTPLGSDDTIWAEPGGIPNHYVIYSGGSEQVGVITRVNGRMVPLRYLVEPLVKTFNEGFASAPS